MDKIIFDKITKEQAIEYANNEADIGGYPKGSEKWKKSFKDYLSYALSTMSVGRNPRNFRYKVYTTLYPDVFGEQGFAGKIAKSYIKEDGTQGIPLKDAQARILSSVMNLSKLFENGIMNTRTSTKGNAQGKISNENISELQFPEKGNMSDEEYEAEKKDVVYHWMQRDMVTNAILESLNIVFRISKSDIEGLMAAMPNLDQIPADELMKIERQELIKRLRAQVGPRLAPINYKKLVLG